MTLHRRRFVSLAALTGAAGLAGCMGDGDGGGEGDGDAADDADGNASDGAADDGDASDARARGGYPDYDWSKLEGVEPVATDQISMENTSFIPLVTRVPVDTRITVSNEDSIPHTFTVPRAGIDERISGGGQTSVRFDEPGTYEYVCTLHPPGMLGRIEVEEADDGGNASAG